MTRRRTARRETALAEAGNASVESPPARASTEPATRLPLRILGALAVLAVGVIHLEQYFAVHYRDIPTIGWMFALNFASAVIISVLLLVPKLWLGRVIDGGAVAALGLLALSGVGLAVLSAAFLVTSQSVPLFGFQESGYRAAMFVALAAEAAATVLLGAYMILLMLGSREQRAAGRLDERSRP